MDIMQTIDALRKGASYSDLANLYGVSVRTIQQLVSEQRKAGLYIPYPHLKRRRAAAHAAVDAKYDAIEARLNK